MAKANENFHTTPDLPAEVSPLHGGVGSSSNSLTPILNREDQRMALELRAAAMGQDTALYLTKHELPPVDHLRKRIEPKGKPGLDTRVSR